MFRTLVRGFSAASLGLALIANSLVAQESTKPIMPFNGKDLTGWKVKGGPAKSLWKVGVAKLSATNDRQLTLSAAPSADKAELVNDKTGDGGADIYTEQKFGDCTIILEVMVPKGSNSGIYVAGEYEIQVLDSFGKATVGKGDLGGIYEVAAPVKNAAKAPGEWQKFEIVYQAPKFEGDKKIANAKFIKVVLNGVTIHENVEMVNGVTPTGVTRKEAATGPLMFQGDHGPVAFRNIQIIPKK